MSLPLSLRPLARSEYDGAVAWYEDARPGLGDDFEAAVRAVFNTIADSPNRYPLADAEVREAPVIGFPYCVYYRVRSGKVVVLAVYHQSRDPAGWRGRV